MVRDINHLGNQPLIESQSKSSDLKSTAKEGQLPAEPVPEAPKGSQVELSSQASSLKAAEVHAQSLPDVDLERVARVKAALENNEYNINNQQVADKMLAFDALLAN